MSRDKRVRSEMPRVITVKSLAPKIKYFGNFHSDVYDDLTEENILGTILESRQWSLESEKKQKISEPAR